MLSSLCTCYPPFPPPLSSILPRWTNPTNTAKVILTVMCTCAPLLPLTSSSPSSSSRYARPFRWKLLMTNPHVLQSPPSISLADRLTHVISRFSSLVYRCSFVGPIYQAKLTTDNLCSSPHPFKHKIKVVLFCLISMSGIKTVNMCVPESQPTKTYGRKEDRRGREGKWCH